jgi:hypothetical protein
MSLDLEVSVNGRRLKEGPYTTLMRPARLDPAKSLLMGAGMHGAQPGEEQVLLLHHTQFTCFTGTKVQMLTAHSLARSRCCCCCCRR